MRRLLITLLGMGLIAGAEAVEGVRSAPQRTFAQAETIQGHWMTDVGTVISMTSCGAAICGRIVAFEGDQGAREARPPEGLAEARAICGLEILNGLSERDAGIWSGGRLYDPLTAERYDASARLEGDRLFVRAYLRVETFGETMVWTRVAAPGSPCSAGA